MVNLGSSELILGIPLPALCILMLARKWGIEMCLGLTFKTLNSVPGASSMIKICVAFVLSLIKSLSL